MNRFKPQGRYSFVSRAHHAAMVARERGDIPTADRLDLDARRTMQRIAELCPTAEERARRAGVEQGYQRSVAIVAATGATLLGLGAL